MKLGEGGQPRELRLGERGQPRELRLGERGQPYELRLGERGQPYELRLGDTLMLKEVDRKREYSVREGGGGGVCWGWVGEKQEKR